MKQQCLSLISELSLSQISSTSTAAPIFQFQTYLYIHYNALACKQHDPCHPYLHSNHPWGSNGRLWQLLRRIPASWIGTFGNLNYPWDCFSHFELQSHVRFASKMTFPFSSWVIFVGSNGEFSGAVNYMFYASERIWSGITRVHHCISARYLYCVYLVFGNIKTYFQPPARRDYAM